MKKIQNVLKSTGRRHTWKTFYRQSDDVDCSTDYSKNLSAEKLETNSDNRVYLSQGTQNPFISRRNTRSTDDCCAINPIVWLNKQSAIGRFLEIWLQITWAQFIWIWQQPCFLCQINCNFFFKSIFNKIQPVACCFLFYFTFFYNQILIYRKNYTKFVQH